MSDPVAELVRTAGQLANAGRLEEAERVWREVHRLEPKHPKALFSLAIHALRREEVSTGLTLLRAARELAPTDLAVLMALWGACRLQGDAAAEREAIEAALALDPYFLPALLARAAWFERRGDLFQAASTYMNCLKIAPPEHAWPAALKPQLAHARDVVARHVTAYEAFLERRLAGPRAALPTAQAGRWREAESILARRTQPYHAACNQLHVPRLPAIPFFDRSLFSWCTALEAKTDVIRAELAAMLAHERGQFRPYIANR
jgi:aspartate beta-hydroxylase